MFFPIRRAGTRAGLVLAMVAAGGSLASSAHAEEERRALRLDEITTDQRESAELRALAEQKRLESISRLKALLSDAPDDSRKAEMMLRLADLYYEQGKADYFDEMDAYNKKFDECFNTAEDPTTCETLKPDNTNSFGWYKRSIKLYEGILKRYPRHPRADQATFFLGMTYKDIQQESKALAAFKKLVKLYPQSGRVPESYVLIGEYYFDRNEAFPALRAYLKASQFEDSPQWGYATYKLSWCYFNVEEYDKAINGMKAVVQRSMAEEQATGQKIRLSEEALRDLVRFFAESNKIDEAYAYFEGLGRRELIRAMLKRLAHICNEQGRYGQEVDTYRRLIAEDPKHEEAPEYQNSIINAYRQMDAKDKVLEEIRKLREDYSPESAWAQANASNPKALTLAADTIEKALSATAHAFNKEARELQKAKHPRAKAAFDAAVAAYEVYMESYGDDKRSYTAHYDFGELLWDLKRYEDAYTHYMAVVKLDPKGEYSRACAESAIFAAEKMVTSEGGGEISTAAVKVDKDVQPKELTKWEQALIAACGQYAELYEGDKKVEIAIYKSAYLLYSRYHFTEAADQFRKVISRWPKSERAERAAHLILDALAIREEWTSIKETSKAFWTQEGLGSDKFKKEMHDIYSSSSFKVIELDFAANKDYSKTADAFVAFAEEFPEFEKVDFAYNNAAVYYWQSDRIADSMKIRHILIEDERFKGKTQFYYDSIGTLGESYERVADLAKATEYYDLFISMYDDERKKLADDKEKKQDEKDKALTALDERVATYLYSSALFHNAMGDWEGAIERYENYIEHFPTKEAVTGMRLEIAKIYEKHDQHEKAADAFSAYYSKPASDASTSTLFYARLHHGRSLMAADKKKEALDVYKKSVAAYKKLVASGAPEEDIYNELVAEGVAEMMHTLLQQRTDEYFAQNIAGAGIESADGLSGSRLRAAIKKEDKAMKSSLQAKTKGLKELIGSYQEISATRAAGGGLEAIVMIGRLYESMADALDGAPVPFYLDQDQADYYRMGLQDKVYGQVENAVGFYKQALTTSYDLHYYNEATAFATRRLGELRPDDFPGLEEMLPEPGYTAESARSYDAETSLD